MLEQIIFQSDWWLHLLSNLILWGILFLIESKYLKKNFSSQNVLIQLLLSNLIDLDHLFSSSLFDASRCSINNHFLHSFFVFPIYLLGLLSRFRYFFMGIILHLIIDSLGCIF